MKNTRNKRLGGFIKTGEDSGRNLLKFNLALLFSIMAMIFVLPVIPSDEPLLNRIILILIVISGLYAADLKINLFRILFGFGTIVVGLAVISLILIDFTNLTIILFFLFTAFFLLVTVALVSHVARAERVNGSTLILAINSYLLIGLSMSLLFVIISLYVPHSFGIEETGEGLFSQLIYFAFVTLSTLGYGDITPQTPLARSLSTFTALVGQLYLVIIMALIIGKFLNTKGSDQELK